MVYKVCILRFITPISGRINILVFWHHYITYEGRRRNHNIILEVFISLKKLIRIYRVFMNMFDHPN